MVFSTLGFLASDIQNTDSNNEIFLKKVQKAKQALSQLNGDSILTRTLSKSFNKKWPYSNSPSNINSIPTKIEFKRDKEKISGRPYYVPIVKRRSSKFGLGQLIGYTLPSNSITGNTF
uniref:Uncharacterized protein n=1 Tax=Trichogramma kaykai TaxID=54128 RepID=A0ABD2W1T7_9HYME